VNVSLHNLKPPGGENKAQRAIDLRSDTVTQPTPEMRRAMAG
jgi:hypothetical protein